LGRVIKTMKVDDANIHVCPMILFRNRLQTVKRYRLVSIVFVWQCCQVIFIHWRTNIFNTLVHNDVKMCTMIYLFLNRLQNVLLYCKHHIVAIFDEAVTQHR